MKHSQLLLSMVRCKTSNTQGHFTLGAVGSGSATAGLAAALLVSLCDEMVASIEPHICWKSGWKKAGLSVSTSSQQVCGDQSATVIKLRDIWVVRAKHQPAVDNSSVKVVND